MNEQETVRFMEMDRDLVALKVANAQLAVTVAGLAQQVADLSRTVKDLNNTMHTGKGALLGVMFLAGAVGALVTTFAKKVLGIV